jgi:rhomboid protease GluP
MAWGISPYKQEVVPLGDYNADFYLTLIFHAIENLGWHVGYFDHDGIMAYTNISWASYAEEVSIRIKNNTAVIRSECVGYQGLFTDYGKNAKNLDLLFSEIGYINYMMEDHLEESTQELMNAVPENQFLNLDDPPMIGKQTLRGFFSVFVPKKYYAVTPILVIINILVYIVTTFAMIALLILAGRNGHIYNHDYWDKTKSVYLMMGYSDRSQVLNGQVWRLFTCTFLHFSLLHIAGNMIALIYIGSLIESKIGKLNFILLYLATGIIASMVSVMWREDGLSAGASGAIFGLFGILLALCSTDFYERSARKALLISTIFFVVINIIPIGRGIDHAAHFGGLISGYIFGLITYAALKSNNLPVKKSAAPILAIIITIAFVTTGMTLTPDYQLKNFTDLKYKTEAMAEDIHADFYDQNGITRKQQLDTLEQKALPELKSLSKAGAAMIKLRLPSKKKKEAAFRARLIEYQCAMYRLLYLEYKTQDHVKYRQAIGRVTDSINNVREEMTPLFN